MQLVHIARNLVEAHLVAGFLESAGIRAYVDNEMLQGVIPEVGMDAAAAPRVFVSDEDHARAARMLAERGADTAAEPSQDRLPPGADTER